MHSSSVSSPSQFSRLCACVVVTNAAKLPTRGRIPYSQCVSVVCTMHGRTCCVHDVCASAYRETESEREHYYYSNDTIRTSTLNGQRPEREVAEGARHRQRRCRTCSIRRTLFCTVFVLCLFVSNCRAAELLLKQPHQQHHHNNHRPAQRYRFICAYTVSPPAPLLSTLCLVSPADAAGAVTVSVLCVAAKLYCRHLCVCSCVRVCVVVIYIHPQAHTSRNVSFMQYTYA